MNIGIIGGSFDPVHWAHLVIAEQFVEQCELDRCFIVPAAVNPLKTGAAPAGGEHRAAMLRLAFDDNPKFAIDRRELERGGKSYTVDTLGSFFVEYPMDNRFFLIGDDAAAEFTRWHNWQELLEFTRLCVAPRPVAGRYADADPYSGLTRLSATLAALGVPPDLLPLPVYVPLCEVSSTDVRRRVAEGRSIRYLVPDAVRGYIYSNKLYHAR